MEDQDVDMDGSQATSPSASPSQSDLRAARTRARTRFRNQRTLWTTRMERSLLKALLEAKRDNIDASSHSFKSGAWMAAVEQAQRWTPQRLTREICDNRWRKIKFQYKLWQQHKQNVSSTWIFDERRKTYVPKKKEIAVEYFDKNPEMKIFRDTGPSHVDIVSHLLDSRVGFARTSEEYQQALESLEKEERQSSVEVLSDDSPQPSTPAPPTPPPAQATQSDMTTQPPQPAQPAQAAEPAQATQSTAPSQPAQNAQNGLPTHPAQHPQTSHPPTPATTGPPQPPPAPTIPVNWTPIHHYPPPRQTYPLPPSQPQPPPQPHPPPPPPPASLPPQPQLSDVPVNLERQLHALYNILQAADIQRIGKGLSDICMALGSITQVLEDPCQKAITLFLAESTQLFPEWQDPSSGRVPFSRCRAVLQALQTPGASNVYLALHHVRPLIDRREYIIELLRERGMM